MCYSAQIEASYWRYVRDFGATLSLPEFVRVFFWREKEAAVKIPKAVEAAFAAAEGDDFAEIRASVERYRAAQATLLQQTLFEQRKRLVDAERELQSRVTKKASESRRIAASKVDWALAKLADLRRTEATIDDARIFPGWYCPVMVMQQGRRVVLPMRYQCRPAGKPKSYDQKFPGTFNARRDNLEGFWRGQFGRSHGIALVHAFYENVPLHKVEGRALQPGEAARNTILEFRPRTGEPMLVACLWSRWTAPGEDDLLSFAAITDEPPPEVLAAGHDRCVIPIRRENLDAWLAPDPRRLADSYRILDERERPYYEHRMAA